MWNPLGLFRRGAQATTQVAAAKAETESDVVYNLIQDIRRQLVASGFRDSQYWQSSTLGIKHTEDLSNLSQDRLAINVTDEFQIIDGQMTHSKGVSLYHLIGYKGEIERGTQWWVGGGWSFSRFGNGGTEYLAIRAHSEKPASVDDVEVEGVIQTGDGHIRSLGRVSLREFLETQGMPTSIVNLIAASGARGVSDPMNPPPRIGSPHA